MFIKKKTNSIVYEIGNESSICRVISCVGNLVLLSCTCADIVDDRMTHERITAFDCSIPLGRGYRKVN